MGNVHEGECSASVEVDILEREYVEHDDEFWEHAWTNRDFATRLRELSLNKMIMLGNVDVMLTQAVVQINQLILDPKLMKEHYTEVSNCVLVLRELAESEESRDLILCKKSVRNNVKMWMKVIELYGDDYDNVTHFLVSIVLKLCFCVGVCGPTISLWETGLVCPGLQGVAHTEETHRKKYEQRQHMALNLLISILEYFPQSRHFVKSFEAPYTEEILLSLLNVVFRGKNSSKKGDEMTPFQRDAMLVLTRFLLVDSPGSPHNSNVHLTYISKHFKGDATMKFVLDRITQQQGNMMSLFRIFLENNDEFMSYASSQHKSYRLILMRIIDKNDSDDEDVSNCMYVLNLLLCCSEVSSSKLLNSNVHASFLVSVSPLLRTKTSSCGEILLVICLRKLQRTTTRTSYLVLTIERLVMLLNNMSGVMGEIFVDHLLRPGIMPILIRCVLDTFETCKHPCLRYSILRRADKIRQIIDDESSRVVKVLNILEQEILNRGFVDHGYNEKAILKFLEGWVGEW